MTGENLLPALTDILLQWRLHRYVLAADIEKMYRQILVHPADRELQKILWRGNEKDAMQEFQLNTVIYGLACAPFLAIRTLRQLVDDEAEHYPLGAAVMRSNVYVDDILAGADTLKEARLLQSQLISLCKGGGFPLKKWTSNVRELLDDIPEEDKMPPDPREWQPLDCHSMLGLRWHSHSDSFSFSVKTGDADPVTKRIILSKTAQLFDPLCLWEAVVKSTKHHLRRVIGESTLTFEEMATLLAQIEACLNSRPLQALSDDHNDLAALTPGHFLVDTALNAVPEKSLLEKSVSTLARWQHVQQMRDHFWDRWSREYLQALIPRPKWRKSELSIDTGRLCVILNEATPPTKWPLARVVKLHPGEDGRIRVVTVKTATSELVRPISKLILLPHSEAKARHESES